jgi:catechol 2,3-dioxygenase-like lactoylglutathione lyase family enzyme
MNKLARSKLVPLLVDRDAARAIDFYVRALGANEIARYMNVGFDVLVTPSRDS